MCEDGRGVGVGTYIHGCVGTTCANPVHSQVGDCTQTSLKGANG